MIGLYKAITQYILHMFVVYFVIIQIDKHN